MKGNQMILSKKSNKNDKNNTSLVKKDRSLPSLSSSIVVLKSKEKIRSPIKHLPSLSSSAPGPINKKAQYRYKLLPGNNVRVLLGCLRRRPWWHACIKGDDADTSNKGLTFLWEMYRSRLRYKDNSYVGVMLNHLQRNHCLVTKKGLYFCLKRYCDENNLDILSIVPRTFYLASGSMMKRNNNIANDDLDDFLAYNKQKESEVSSESVASTENKTHNLSSQLLHGINDENTNVNNNDNTDNDAHSNSIETVPNTNSIQSTTPPPPVYSPRDSNINTKKKCKLDGVIWILKPASLTNRGFGIKVVRGIDETIAVTKRSSTANNENEDKPLAKAASKRGAQEGWIVQEYMERPLLVCGRKFDIRCFVLLTLSSRKGLRGYFFRDAYVRTSCKKYSLDKLEDRETHLTNDAVQKNAKSYGKFESGNKLDFEQWQEVINNDYPHAPQNVVNDTIFPEIKRLTTLSIVAASEELIQTDIRQSFELLGYDYMVGEDFKPKLIEINSNPCLEFACPLLTRIISSLIENVVRTGLDPVFPPPPEGLRTKACEEIIQEIESEENLFTQIYP